MKCLSARPLVLFFLALGVSAGAAPSAARASCGDYVHVGETPSENARPAPPRPEPKPIPPCSGPNCSRGETPPPVVPVTAPPAGEWAYASSATVLERDEEDTFWQINHDRPISGESRSVYHPPRPGC
jgi:hypothetical protein